MSIEIKPIKWQVRNRFFQMPEKQALGLMNMFQFYVEHQWGKGNVSSSIRLKVSSDERYDSSGKLADLQGEIARGELEWSDIEQARLALWHRCHAAERQSAIATYNRAAKGVDFSTRNHGSYRDPLGLAVMSMMAAHSNTPVVDVT